MIHASDNVIGTAEVYVMNIKELARLAKRHQSREARSQLKLLDRLREIDPEVAARAVYVFDDPADAASWLANPVMTLGGLTPLQALAEGRRADVLRVLDQLFYGINA